MEIRLDGKRALVTGAGKGIGRAICMQLVACGSETFALSRTQRDLDSLKDELPNINVINLDVTDWDKTREEITKIGQLDLLVNNAGIGGAAPFLEMPKETLDSVLEVNFKAAFNVAQIVAKGMVEKGNGGVIVNVSSLSSTIAVNRLSVYGSTKAALDMLTKCMALELGPHKIRVNAVNPTYVWTPMTLPNAEKIKSSTIMEDTPLGRFAELEDVVNTVIFLLSDKSAMISGECIRIDGGRGVH